MKKLLLTLGSAAAVVAPLATVVACGSDKATVNVITVKEALAAEDGTEITIRVAILEVIGTNGRDLIDEHGDIINMYDNAFEKPAGSETIGEWFEITGTKSEYFGTPQIGSLTSWKPVSIDAATSGLAVKNYVEKQNAGLLTNDFSSDFTLPTSILGADVTWTSDGGTNASIGEATDGKFPVTVVQPAEADGDKEVVLTATSGDLSADLTINILNDSKSAYAPKNVYELSIDNVGEFVSVTGMLTSVSDNAAFSLNDSSGTIATYDNTFDYDEAAFNVGDFVTIEGVVAEFSGGIQLNPLNSITSVAPVDSILEKIIESEVLGLSGTRTGNFNLPTNFHGEDITYTANNNDVTITDGQVTVGSAITDSTKVTFTATYLSGKTTDFDINVQYAVGTVFDFTSGDLTTDFEALEITSGENKIYSPVGIGTNSGHLGMVKIGTGGNAGSMKYLHNANSIGSITLKGAAWNGDTVEVAIVALDVDGNPTADIVKQTFAGDALIAGGETSIPAGFTPTEYAYDVSALDLTHGFAITTEAAYTTNSDFRVVIQELFMA